MRNEKWGIIEKIRIFPAKGEAGIELTEGRLLENLGIEGDFHTKPGDPSKPEAKQISLMIAGNSRPLNTAGEKGLCTGRFKENITIRFPEPPGTPVHMAGEKSGWYEHMKSGLRLSAGEAILEISGETKRCHEECPLFQAGEHCSLAGKNLFARVLKGALIHTGDRIGIIH